MFQIDYEDPRRTFAQVLFQDRYWVDKHLEVHELERMEEGYLDALMGFLKRVAGSWRETAYEQDLIGDRALSRDAEEWIRATPVYRAIARERVRRRRQREAIEAHKRAREQRAELRMRKSLRRRPGRLGARPGAQIFYGPRQNFARPAARNPASEE